MSAVVGVGIATVDYLCVVERLPELDRKTTIESFSIQGGGPVATALVTLQRLGVSTALVARVGDDTLGQFIVADLQREGVNTSDLVLQQGVDSSFSFIMIERGTGKRSVAHYDPGERTLSPDSVPVEQVQAATILHIDGHEADAQVRAATLARERGVTVIYDGGSVRPRCGDLCALADYLISSEHFPVEFTGIRRLPRAMEKLLEYGPKAVVATLGARGCRVATREGGWELPPAPVGPIVDTTGAGDVFHGAFMYGLLHQWDLRRICDFANITAGLKCRHLGGRDGIPTMSDIERVMLHR